jgi:hypothetical protein
MTGPQAPPGGKEKAGPLTKDRPSAKNIATPDDKPILRPWGDDPEVELRFQRDRRQWRRRILCSRRLSHDGRDELVAPWGGWSR